MHVESVYQCLIVMVYDNQTSFYAPVVYALMTHKNTNLYYQVFFQLKVITQGKMVLRTYTSDFERAEMSQLVIHFPQATHLGCLFHLKQAWFKYLKDKLGLGHQSMSLGPATKVGGLDILCVLLGVNVWSIILIFLSALSLNYFSVLTWPFSRGEVLKYGIPYVHTVIGKNGITPIPNWELDKWAIFWKYSEKQWMPILLSWNICN